MSSDPAFPYSTYFSQSPNLPGLGATGIESRVRSGYGSPMSIAQEGSPRHSDGLYNGSPMSVVLDTSGRWAPPLLIHADQNYPDRLPHRGQRQRPEPDSLQTLLAKRADLDLTSKVTGISRSQQTHGGWSDIFIGCMRKPRRAKTKVAVKRLRVHIMQPENEKAQKMIARELYIWSKLDHRNILPLEGFPIEDNEYPSLVSKWMENGPMLGYLISHPEADILRLITGIANAVSYLHKQQIVHSDIKPDNILISEHGEPLLCDFGFARMMESSGTFNLASTSSMNCGTLRFMAKELFEASDSETSVYTKESDIWAFGMTVFALLTRSLPYSHLRHEAAVIAGIMRGELPRRPADMGSWPSCNIYVWEWCTRCWSVSPSRRPSIKAIISAMVVARLSRDLLSQFPPT